MQNLEFGTITVPRRLRGAGRFVGMFSTWPNRYVEVILRTCHFVELQDSVHPGQVTYVCVWCVCACLPACCLSVNDGSSHCMCIRLYIHTHTRTHEDIRRILSLNMSLFIFPPCVIFSLQERVGLLLLLQQPLRSLQLQCMRPQQMLQKTQTRSIVNSTVRLMQDHVAQPSPNPKEPLCTG